jgi:thiol-disulfide isomerase/thioredoxin
MKSFLFLLLCSKIFRLFFLALIISIQLTSDVKSQGLQVNTKMPDITLKSVLNHNASTLRIYQYQGKSIIFDFWGLNCVSCIKEFPKLDSFQKEFGDRLQIILVNKESKEATQRFFSSRKQIHRPNLPMVCGDTLLNNLFPHNETPFLAWIDSSMIVKYKTAGYNLTYANLNSFLRKKELRMRTAVEKTIYQESLFEHRWNNQLPFFSYIAHRPKVGLFQTAFNGFRDFHKYDRPGRTILQVSDSFKFVMTKDPQKLDTWFENHCYIYHLVIRKEEEHRMPDIMIEDIKRFSGTDATVEKRDVDCIVLVKTGEENVIKTMGGKTVRNFYRVDLKSTRNDSVRFLINVTYEEFSRRLASYVENAFSAPFIDEVNLFGNVDIQLTGKAIDAGDLTKLNEELKRLNLKLVREKRFIDVLVIKEKIIK